MGCTAKGRNFGRWILTPADQLAKPHKWILGFSWMAIGKKKLVIVVESESCHRYEMSYSEPIREETLCSQACRVALTASDPSNIHDGDQVDGLTG